METYLEGKPLVVITLLYIAVRLKHHESYLLICWVLDLCSQSILRVVIVHYQFDCFLKRHFLINP